MSKKSRIKPGCRVVYRKALLGSVKRTVPLLRLAEVGFGLGIRKWVPYRDISAYTPEVAMPFWD